MVSLETSFSAAVARCLAETNAEQKSEDTLKLRELSVVETDRRPIAMTPGRPPRPSLVPPRDLPRRKLTNVEGHAAFCHAICHIEFTAINLALDAMVRFPTMPDQYYLDWVRVAAEEATHFRLLRGHLNTLGFDYGDFPAHSGLWDTAERTGDDLLRRMALVPRVMEARGLDVTPRMITRLIAIDDIAGARILEQILAEEVEHVRIGTTWFRYLCAERKLDPTRTFSDIIAEELGTLRNAKLNYEARRKAGFTSEELAHLSRAAKSTELVG